MKQLQIAFLKCLLKLASQQEVCIHHLAGSYLEFACSPCVCMSLLWLVQLPPTIYRHTARGVRLTGRFPLYHESKWAFPSTIKWKIVCTYYMSTYACCSIGQSKILLICWAATVARECDDVRGWMSASIRHDESLA